MPCVSMIAIRPVNGFSPRTIWCRSGLTARRVVSGDDGMSSLSSHSLVGKVFAGRREDGQTTLSHSRAERRPYSQRDVVDRPQELVDTLCESSLVRDVQRPDARRVEIANHVGKLGQALGHARLEQTCARLRGLTSSTSFPPIKDRLTFVKVGTGTGCAVVPVTRARQRCAEVLPFLANTDDKTSLRR